MRNKVNKLPAEALTVKAKEIEDTKTFRYLGSLVGTDESPEYKIATHIECAESALDKLRY